MNERLLQLRKTLNVSQEAFGNRLGVTKTTISRLEKGERNLTEQMIKSICREFNVNEEWLRNGTGDMFNPTTDDKLEQLAQQYKFNDIEYKFLRSYLNLDLNKRAAVVEFLEGILNTDSSFMKNSELSATTEKKTIDDKIEEELENYKQELIAESKGEISSALQKPKGA